MERSIDMQRMRYINLFSKVSRVPTMNCFNYNNQILFAVPKQKVSLAIGKNASNVKKLREILGRKIRVIAAPEAKTREDIYLFVSAVVNPIEFSKLEIRDDVITITAGRQSKAALIGRNRIREKELSGIIKDFFGITKLRIA